LQFEVAKVLALEEDDDWWERWGDLICAYCDDDFRGFLADAYGAGDRWSYGGGSSGDGLFNGFMNALTCRISNAISNWHFDNFRYLKTDFYRGGNLPCPSFWNYVSTDKLNDFGQEILRDVFNELNNWSYGDSDPYNPDDFDIEDGRYPSDITNSIGSPGPTNLFAGTGEVTTVTLPECGTDSVHEKTKRFMDMLNSPERTAEDRIQETLRQLIHYAQTSNIEYGTDIRYFFEERLAGRNPYRASAIVAGDARSVRVEYDHRTTVTIHIHPEEAEPGANPNYAAPSPMDFAAVITRAINIEADQNNFMTTRLNEEERAIYLADAERHYLGELMIAYSGHQYFLLVDDLDKVKQFRATYGNDFIVTDRTVPEETGKFKNGTELRRDFDDARREFERRGFSRHNTFTFALTYVLQITNSGITLMQQEPGSDIFEELAVEKRRGRLIPVCKRCPEER